MANYLVDIDEQALHEARAQLGAGTINETVNCALRLVADRAADARQSLDKLADADLVPREQAWR